MATVPTDNGGKYVRQLCKHWAHKLPVELEGDNGTVTFPSAVATMVAGPDAIAITITGEEHDEVERMQDVVARHLDRFAFREAPLSFDWSWPEA